MLPMTASMSRFAQRPRGVRLLVLTALLSLSRVLSGCADAQKASAPVIDTLTPATGAPGTTVLMQGTHFGATPGTVGFQDKDQSFVTAPVVTWTDTAIVITAPTMPSGPQAANVGLQTSEGQTPALPATFNVTTSAP